MIVNAIGRYNAKLPDGTTDPEAVAYQQFLSGHGTIMHQGYAITWFHASVSPGPSGEAIVSPLDAKIYDQADPKGKPVTGTITFETGGHGSAGCDIGGKVFALQAFSGPSDFVAVAP